MLAEVELLGVKVGEALVDEALLAFGAGDRHLLLVMKQLGRVSGPDDRRQAELAADDGGMRCAPAMIGDDRRGAAHDRHPIRIRRPRDQNGAVDEAIDGAWSFRSGKLVPW